MDRRPNDRFGDSILVMLVYFMLDHPITVVINVFDTLKNNWLKVYKFMSIQTQKEHISHIKKSKSDRFQDRYFFFSNKSWLHPYFLKKVIT